MFSTSDRGKARVPSEKRRNPSNSQATKPTKSPESSNSILIYPPSSCRRSLRIRNARQSRSDDKKLNTSSFQSYLDEFWNRISEEKRSSFTFVDCLWFNMYVDGQKAKVVEWIRKKSIFSWRYVFVPIVCWGHWSLLILCNFGEALQSKSNRPCMLLLDSLHDTGPKRLEPAIRKFVLDIYKIEQRHDRADLISKIPLMVPKVPQQKNGEECGIFVLYYIYLFVQNAPECFDQEGYPYFLREDWFSLEDVGNFEKEMNFFKNEKLDDNPIDLEDED